MASESLADARAKAGELQVFPADPPADDAAMRRLAYWATRYTPLSSPWQGESGTDGFFLDVTGAVHLFGSEEKLLADLQKRLADFGLPSRVAITDTPGAGWAITHFHRSPKVVLPSGKETEALTPLPIAALRLSQETKRTLQRLGFKRIGMLIDKPRAPFAARFERELLLRLDRARGLLSEPLNYMAPPPSYRSLRHLMEPIVSQTAIVTVATRLMEDLVPALTRDCVGARSLRLDLYRVDGEVPSIDIGLSLPTCNPAHVARLINLKLERIVETIDAGFGFEAASLTVTATEAMQARQTEFVTTFDGCEKTERVAALVDSLRQRLGPKSVRQLKPVASHIPERAEARSAPTIAKDAWPKPDDGRPRPLLLLAKAEPADVIAAVPEGPPQRFRWRGKVHGVAHAQGPERIASEWWRHQSPRPTRDYYLVEDDRGRRFWLYREGLYGRSDGVRGWFVHGLFA